jgi:hypothetical protein
MRKHSVIKEIQRDTINLHRGRLICALLRREGILYHNPRIVIDLAERLLKSLSHHSSH